MPKPRSSPWRLLITCSLSLGIAPGCYRLPGKPTTSALQELGRGTLNGRDYKHDYFNLSVQVPEGWHVQSQAETDDLQKLGNEIATGQGADPKLKQAIEASKAHSLTLLTIFQHPVGTPVPFNANITVMAERVSHVRGIRTGADYCQHLKKALNMSAIKYQFDEIESDQKIGSLKAHCMPMHTSLNGVDVNQRYYAARHKDYMLAMILSYSTEEQREQLEEVVAAVQAGG